jgi:hypothetical protein
LPQHSPIRGKIVQAFATVPHSYHGIAKGAPLFQGARIMKRDIIAIMLMLAMSGAAGAQGSHGHVGLHSLAPRMSTPNAASRAGGSEPVNPGLELPDSSIFGTNTPTGRAEEGLEFNNQLRNGMPNELPSETPVQ